MQSHAKSIDQLGFDGALLATGPGTGPEPWITAASLINITEQLKFLVAVHPSLLSPTKFAQLAHTVDAFSGGRLLVNIISGAGSFESVGVSLTHDERYRHTDEFLDVYRRIAVGETVDFEGEFVRVKGATNPLPSVQTPYPPLWFGGSSDPAIEVAAKHIDTYLTWGEPPELAGEKISRVRARAAEFGRKIRFGIRLTVIVRDTEQEAWAAAQDLLDHMDQAAIDAVQGATSGGQSVGWERQQALHGWRKPKHARELEVSPNLWSGLALVLPGPGIAVVGDPDTVAARLFEYQDIGFDTFILSSFPLIEESYRVAEDLVPLLRAGKRSRADVLVAAG